MVSTAQSPLTAKDYKSDVKPTWCPGCGDYGVLSGTYKAMTALQLEPHNVVIVSGIGCSSRFPHFVRTYGFHGVHGRALPLAQGVKLGNPELTVLAMGGDGDFFSIGAGHFPHAARRNMDITCVVMDNEIYGLTKGQTSPTSPQGKTTKTSPYGELAAPLNPVTLAISQGATFVARGYSARPAQLADLIQKALEHKGFSFVHAVSPCVMFNDTFDMFNGLVEEIDEATLHSTELADAMVADVDAGYRPHDRLKALELAVTEEKVHLGVFLDLKGLPTFDEEQVEKLRVAPPLDMNAFFARYK